jgi:hypothetical protein
MQQDYPAKNLSLSVPYASNQTQLTAGKTSIWHVTQGNHNFNIMRNIPLCAVYVIS